MLVEGTKPSNGAKDPSKMSDQELNTFLMTKGMGRKDPSHMSDAELDNFLKTQSTPWIDKPGTVQNLAKGTINAIPTVGGIAGGLIGGAAGGIAGAPVGGVGAIPASAAAGAAGAGLGYGGGEAIKNLIYSGLGSKDAPKNSDEAILGPIEAIPAGAAAEMGGQVIGKAASKILPRIASSMSGVPEQDVNTLVKNPDEIKGLINETEGKVSGKIDEARGAASNSLKTYKAGLNTQIKQGLSKYGPEKNIDIDPIMKSIDRAKEQVNPKLNPEVIADINSIQKRISDLTDGSGKASVSDINDIRSYLGDLGSGSAPKPTGEGKFFSPKDPGSRAAYYGSGAASDLLKENAPEVGDALSKFGELRGVTKQVTPGLLKEGANDVGFLGAGRGAATRNEDMLKKIDDLTGSDVLGQAQKLSAAKNFGDVKLNPMSLYSGGLMKNPALLREAVFANQSMGQAPSSAAQFSTRPALQSLLHRPDVKDYKTLGRGR